MFTGIIESFGEITEILPEGTNFHYTIKSDLASQLKVDQSVAHDGVCLTVVELLGSEYRVTAIDETLEKTCLSDWSIGKKVNLERAMKLGDRLDGHMVQGHVDQVGHCVAIEDKDGSRIFSFQYDPSLGNVTIEKGSITINGTSLTVVNSKEGGFSVAIIPYTLQHTNFHQFQEGTRVNLEFDLIGKYLKRISQGYL